MEDGRVRRLKPILQRDRRKLGSGRITSTTNSEQEALSIMKSFNFAGHHSAGLVLDRLLSVPVSGGAVASEHRLHHHG